jgi:hypothetical protein
MAEINREQWFSLCLWFLLGHWLPFAGSSHVEASHLVYDILAVVSGSSNGGIEMDAIPVFGSLVPFAFLFISTF